MSSKPASESAKYFLKLATTGVRSLRPYHPGKPIEELEREYGIKQAIKLASNENPLGPSPKAIKALQGELANIGFYPDDNGFRLKSMLAEQHGVSREQITLGNGSCNVLELVVRAFVEQGQEVIFSKYAFAMYPIMTQAAEGKSIVTPAKDWGHDLDAMLAAVNDNTKLVLIANPNNPTGTWLKAEELSRFIKNLPNNVIVVVDEAYFEYANDPGMGAHDYPDTIPWVKDFPNLIVTRTFSKAYGLAGLRVGYGVASPEITDLINRVRQPFNVNNLALVAAEAALEDADHLHHTLQLNNEGMRQLMTGLNSLGLEVIPSVGNFVAVDVKQKADIIYEGLLREGVIVRPVIVYEMPNHLRITIGLPEQNARLLNALQKVLDNHSNITSEQKTAR